MTYHDVFLNVVGGQVLAGVGLQHLGQQGAGQVGLGTHQVSGIPSRMRYYMQNLKYLKLPPGSGYGTEYA